MSYVLSVDVGGTFTDLAAFGEGTVALHKRLTDPADPAAGMLAGIAELLELIGARAGNVSRVVHATTLATNALLERRGASTALLTTAGFADVLEIGAEQMHSIFDLFARYPEPLVPAERRREVAERITANGEVLEKLDEPGVAGLAEELAAAGVQALGVCLLHAYRNGSHEQMVRDIVAARAPGLAVSLSCEVAPTIGEYERTSTVCIDAYLKPLIAGYLEEVRVGLARLGVRAELQLVSSAGGILDPSSAAGAPVRLLESGPAAGAVSAGWFGARAGARDVLAFDLGGTTAKLCLVEDGRPRINPSFEADRTERMVPGSGRPVHTPTVDLLEIGAGGGSIAHVDALGLLQLGPRSAGASPGPACYGRGGTLPTLTDADLLVGVLDGERFLGGRMRLDYGAAERAVREHVAEPLGLDVLDAAAGIRAVAEEAMIRAARAHLQERNRDPRDLALVALGGAGPVHATAMAAALGIIDVIVPRGAGLASALGALTLERTEVAVRTRVVAVAASDWTVLAAIYAEMATSLAAPEPAAADVRYEAAVDVRFTGQFHDLRVELDWPPRPDWPQELEREFRDGYVATYGRVPPGLAVEASQWYLTRTIPQETLPGMPASARDSGDARLADRKVHGTPAVWVSFRRERLAEGAEIAGPAILVEDETSVVVPADWRARVDANLNVLLTHAAA